MKPLYLQICWCEQTLGKPRETDEGFLQKVRGGTGGEISMLHWIGEQGSWSEFERTLRMGNRTEG